jgi:hypothetical protein
MTLLLLTVRDLSAQGVSGDRRFTFGIEWIDAGINIPKVTNKYYNPGPGIIYYNISPFARWGTYRSPYQVELGLKPGFLIGNTRSYLSHDGKNKAYFHMPLFVRLKVNVWKIADDIRFYLSAIGSYNIIRHEDSEDDFSAGGGMGVAVPHWDFSMYYKQDIRANHYNDINRSIGVAAAYCF